MESDMACACGGAYQWNNTLESLVCIKCGRHSPYQRMPSYQELFEENKKLKAEIERLKNDNT